MEGERKAQPFLNTDADEWASRGHGEVYRASDTRLGRAVAIKVSAEKFSEPFEREARAIFPLTRPPSCRGHPLLHPRFRSMFFGMKSKTSITLSKDLLDDLDRVSGGAGNRSRIIEAATREYINRRMREARELRDLELINKNAGALNTEAEDALSYQVKP